MSSSTSPAQALCLLLVVLVAVGAPSAAAKPLPGSCLTAASTLCAEADTHAMRCLRRLVTQGDARVPNACAEAIMAGVTMNPRLKRSSRAARLARLLTEASAACNSNSCPSNFGGAQNLRCNDVLNGCSGCPQGTKVIPTTKSWTTVVPMGSTNNPNSINCANICCQGVTTNGVNGACCHSYSNGGGSTGVWCQSVGHNQCFAN